MKIKLYASDELRTKGIDLWTKCVDAHVGCSGKYLFGIGEDRYNELCKEPLEATSNIYVSCNGERFFIPLSFIKEFVE